MLSLRFVKIDFDKNIYHHQELKLPIHQDLSALYKDKPYN